MDDRELLELAAKAAGTPGEWGEIIDIGGDKVDLTDVFFVSDFPWNPLEDDGDALRLAVKLSLCLDIYTDYHISKHHPHLRASITDAYLPERKAETAVSVTHAQDPLAATRLAIVRAAAEIGRAM